MGAFLRINGKELPFPAYGLTGKRVQMVDSGRNALGQVVAQKIGRRQFKYENLKWAHLTAKEWGDILKEVEKFEGELTYWDALSQSFITRRVYWGDASEEIWRINPETGVVTEYVNCQVNLIDMGYGA